MDVEAYINDVRRLMLYIGMDVALSLADRIINTARDIIAHQLFEGDEYPIYTLGNLYRSLSFYVIPSDEGVRLILQAKSPYAGYVEYGTRPHPVPYEVIEVWAEQKGLEPKGGMTWEEMIYKIVKHIEEEGTKGKPYFQMAIDVNVSSFSIDGVKFSQRTLDFARGLGVRINVGGVV